MRKIITLLTLAFFCISVTNGQNAREAAQNSKQIQEGKKNLERDIQELAAFKEKHEQFKTAYGEKDAASTNKVMGRIISDMKREVKQSTIKAKKAKKEIAQSSAEIRTERREIQRDKKDASRGRFDRRDDKRDLARDRANLKDDQRDRRDDVRDFKEQIARTERQKQILTNLQSYKFTFDDADFESAMVNKNLVLEFIDSMQQDIEATKIELGEDRQERREDKRERRDDRNERNEHDRYKRRG